MSDDDLLTSEEAAAQLRLAATTLQQWRAKRKGPPYYKLGGERGPVTYKRSDLHAWMESRRVEPRRESAA